MKQKKFGAFKIAMQRFETTKWRKINQSLHTWLDC